MTPVLVVFSFLAIAGCEGTETREKEDNTVKEFPGKKRIDRMNRMKKDIRKARQHQADRYKNIEESARKNRNVSMSTQIDFRLGNSPIKCDPDVFIMRAGSKQPGTGSRNALAHKIQTALWG